MLVFGVRGLFVSEKLHAVSTPDQDCARMDLGCGRLRRVVLPGRVWRNRLVFIGSDLGIGVGLWYEKDAGV